MSRETIEKVSATRFSGTVKWFNDEKCFGFIEPLQEVIGVGDNDIFVHKNGFNPPLKTLSVNQRVSFVVGKRGGRFCALEVQLEET